MRGAPGKAWVKRSLAGRWRAAYGGCDSSAVAVVDSAESRFLECAPPEHGAIAQLGERLHGMQEVSGSIPLGSTTILR